jgi:hypothetical protein
MSGYKAKTDFGALVQLMPVYELAAQFEFTRHNIFTDAIP